jgi:hypothetical protein
VAVFVSQRAMRVLRRAIYAYAALLSLIFFGGFDETAREILGGTEAQLFVTSDAPLLNVRASYAGQPIEPRPGWGPGQVNLTYVAFAPMRTRQADPLLEISWQVQDGEWRTLRRTMPRVRDPLCLFVLRLDAAGQAIDDAFDEEAPVWWRCRRRL